MFAFLLRLGALRGEEGVPRHSQHPAALDPSDADHLGDHGELSH